MSTNISVHNDVLSNVLQFSEENKVKDLSFEDLYKRYYQRVYNTCLKMTHNFADAEDLTQEALIHAYRKLSTFRGLSAFTSWLHQLTVNEVLMYFRKSSHRFEHTTEDGNVLRLTEIMHKAKMPSYVDQIALTGAIARLSRGCRTIFSLHDIEGYSHEEIGQMLNISIGTSKSQLHKARMRLRELLNKRAEYN